MNKKQQILLYSLAFILLVAGTLHFIIPQSFFAAMPPYIPYGKELVYVTGVLEWIFALGLIWKKTRYWSAVLTSLYFISILPAHFHVSLHGIPMFGVSSKTLLWLRTAGQGIFIYWAWSMRTWGKESS